MKSKFQPRYEVIPGANGTFGVYDNKAKGVVVTGVSRDEACKISANRGVIELDRMMANLFRSMTRA